MQHLGRYELLKLVGRGGMAEVFEANSVGANGFRRRVAVKRMLDGVVDDPASARMFLDEARLASALHHDSIVAVLDYGIEGTTPFQVMEYVDGIDATKAIRRLTARGMSMPEAVALHVCKEVAYALAHAHEAEDDDGPLGIVHRDVKPSNVLLTWDGAVKLADFGIAIGRGRSERTEAGQVKGTPNYMAPEQLVGLEVDGRADVFGLGCVLNALLTGASPVAGVAGALELLRAGGAPVLATSLSPDVAALIATATQGRPELRFPSARALGGALDALIAARANRDLRRALAECLLPLRSVPAAPSLFDGFLAAGLAADPDGDATAGTAIAAAEPSLVAPRALERLTVEAPVTPARSRARRAVLVGLPLLLLLVVAWALTRTHGGSGASMVAMAARSAAPLAPDASVVRAEPPAASVSALVVPSLAPSANASARPRSADHGPARGAVATSPPAQVDLASDGTTGFVRVRAADGSTTTKILVDGAPRGFAPRVLELATGTHVLSFVDASGRTLGTARVSVGPELTRRAPKDIEIR